MRRHLNYILFFWVGIGAFCFSSINFCKADAYAKALGKKGELAEAVTMGSKFFDAHSSDLEKIKKSIGDPNSFANLSIDLALNAAKNFLLEGYRKYFILELRVFTERFLKDLTDYKADKSKGDSKQTYDTVFKRYFDVMEEELADFKKLFPMEKNWKSDALRAAIGTLNAVKNTPIKTATDSVQKHGLDKIFFEMERIRKLVRDEVIKGNLETALAILNSFLNKLNNTFPEYLGDSAFDPKAKEIPCVAKEGEPSKIIWICDKIRADSQKKWPSYNQLLNKK